MVPTQARLIRKLSWFWWALIAIWIGSLFLRFWGLGRFNSLVFDEVHFAKFANSYLTQTPFLDNHPPLGKYFIAVGIWLSQWLPFGQGETNDLLGRSLTASSYRWMNALMGSFIPLVVAGLAYQLSKRRTYGLIAGVFAALDGLFLVESRYALINIYLVLFGLLGLWLLLIAIEQVKKTRSFLLILAGICLGASFSVKWNGLAFLLATYLLWGVAKGIQWFKTHWLAAPNPMSDSINLPIASALEVSNLPTSYLPPAEKLTLLDRIAQIRLEEVAFELTVVPLVTYGLIWIPHLFLNTDMNFWEWQTYLYSSQKSVGNTPDVHPYCSAWYTWIFLARPVSYYFKSVVDETSSKALLSQAPQEVYYDVHALGNPALWWLSTAAIILLLSLMIQKLALLSYTQMPAEQKIKIVASNQFLIPLYLLVGYVANLLPWLSVTRCTFLYHYMGASIFSLLAIAWVTDRCLRDRRMLFQGIGGAIIFLVAFAFVYWLPIYWGLPLSPLDFQSRMWFHSWY